VKAHYQHLSRLELGYGVPVERGRNQVRPQDVGRRVSFQYELPNGYVGEAVGLLEAWDEAANTYLVRNRHGELVRVPALGVRFGKVIPG
jgi:hypothetical protein